MNSLRKWFNKPKKEDSSKLAQFYWADEELNMVAAELDSFDGRKDPERCSALVNQLRLCQDKVLNVCTEIMEEAIHNARTSRDFRAKFPDDVLQENLAGQLWFGAECLAAGSSIMNREVESARMRPLAKALTRSLDSVRCLLREQCLRNPQTYSDKVTEALEVFDRLFAEFELCYVSAMVPVKSAKEYHLQQGIVVLFSETLQRALSLNLISQEAVDDYDPLLMFTIPRLAIVCGLLIYPDGSLNVDGDPSEMSELFRPFYSLLHKVRDLLWTLSRTELHLLEKTLCSLEEPESMIAFQCSASQNSPYPIPDSEDYIHMFYENHQNCKQFIQDFYAYNFGVLPNETREFEVADQAQEAFEEPCDSVREERVTVDFLPMDAELTQQDGCSDSDTDSVSSEILNSCATEVGCHDWVGERTESKVGSSDSNDVVTTVPGGSDDFSGGNVHMPLRRCNQNGTLESSGLDAPLTDNFMGSASSPQPAVVCCCHHPGFDTTQDSICPCHVGESNKPEILNPDLTCLDLYSCRCRDEPKKCTCQSDPESCHTGHTTPTSLAEQTSERNSSIHRHLSSVSPSLQCSSHFLRLSGLSQQPFSTSFSVPTSASTPVATGHPPLCRLKPHPKRHSERVKHHSHSQKVDCILEGSKTKVQASSESLSHINNMKSFLSNNSAPVMIPQVLRLRGEAVGVGASSYSSCSSCRTETSVSSSDWNSSSCHSTETSSFNSDCQDDEEIALALQAAEIASRNKARSRFKSSEDLIHRLFVCISGVADQLQTNYASDMRNVLKCVFDMNCTKTPSFHESETESLDSNEEANHTIQMPEVEENGIFRSNNAADDDDDRVSDRIDLLENTSLEDFLSDYTPEDGHLIVPEVFTSHGHVEVSRQHGDIENAQEAFDHHMVQRADCQDDTVQSVSSSPDSAEYEDPPMWLPDELTAYCMSCEAAFTLLRRRHHCRNCGKIFCSRCSSNSIPLPRYGHLKPVRVCNSCFMYQVTPFVIPQQY